MIALNVPLSTLLQTTTPETSGYLIAGYVVIFVVMLGYLIRLIVRKHNLEQDYEMLEELEKSGSTNNEPVRSDHVGAMQK